MDDPEILILNYIKSSWGSTLSLAYAQTHPNRVVAMILRGIFTLRKSELDWFYQEGASWLFPDIWESFLDPIPLNERHDMVTAYYKRLTGDNEYEKVACAKAWSKWECATSRLLLDPSLLQKAETDEWAVAFARIECHYFYNKGFFTSDEYLLENVDKIRHIPCVIVQGRYDVVCPAKTAWDLHQKWPEAELIMIPDAGHSAKELNTTKELVKAADRFKVLTPNPY